MTETPEVFGNVKAGGLCLKIILPGFLLVSGNTIALLIHHSKIIHTINVSSFCRLSVPLHRFRYS